MTDTTGIASMPQSEQETQERQASDIAKAFCSSDGEERERLARIMDLLPCYVALMDTSHNIIFHNKAFEQYFGKPEGRRCYAALREQESPCRFCTLADGALNANTSSVMEWVHPNSRHAFRVYSYPFTDIDGSRRVLEAGFNITANLRVQQALDLSEQSYRTITDNLSIGIALINPALQIKTGNIRLGMWFAEGFQLNRQICELLQCGAEWERAIAEQGHTCPGCPFKASLDDAASHEKELQVTFQDGKERTVRLVTCPVLPAKGKGARVKAIIMMLEDITNRIQVNQQLQRARKLEAMNTLAGGIAHEINQPLSALHLYAGGLQMLLEKDQELPKQVTEERISLIMREADKIRSIIAHMRALVMKEGNVILSGVALVDAVSAVKKLMDQQFKSRGIELETHIPADLPLVRANDTQLEQVLVNLLANAMHAIGAEEGEQEPGQGGKIAVRAYRIAERPRVRLEVADSGPGLAEGSEHIFDPFYTTKERHEGMGLGLSIVHGLVSLWGGEIVAATRDAELGGALFSLDMPIVEQTDHFNRKNI